MAQADLGTCKISIEQKSFHEDWFFTSGHVGGLLEFLLEVAAGRGAVICYAVELLMAVHK